MIDQTKYSLLMLNGSEIGYEQSFKTSDDFRISVDE